MSLIEGVVLYEEFGRSLAPTPHFVSAVLCGGRAGHGRLRRPASGVDGTDRDRRGHLHPGLVRAREQLRPCRCPGPGRAPTATASGSRAPSATWPSPPPPPAWSSWPAPGTRRPTSTSSWSTPTAAGVTLTQQHSHRVRRPVPASTSTDVRVTADDRIGEPGSGWRTWDAVMHDGCILLGAQAMGGARQALDITVQYAKDRSQFDKPLGAFQALAHYLADAATTVDGGTTLVHEAAWARAAGRPVDRLAPMAKLFACQTYRDVTAMAQQIFGGIGFSVEFDIQLYFRRAKQLQISWWDTRYLEELVAAAVLDHRA